MVCDGCYHARTIPDGGVAALRCHRPPGTTRLSRSWRFSLSPTREVMARPSARLSQGACCLKKLFGCQGTPCHRGQTVTGSGTGRAFRLGSPSIYNGHFSAKSRVCICKHFVNKLPSPAVRRCNSFCFYGIAAAIGLRHTNGNIGVTISNIRPECFSFSLPLLQFQKRFLASSANKAFEIIRPAHRLPLLRSGAGDLAKPDKKNGQDFRLAQSAQAISSSLFNLNTSQMSLIRS